MSDETFRERVNKVRTAVASLKAVLRPQPMSTDERKVTTGRFREGESVALSAVIDGTALRPETFTRHSRNAAPVPFDTEGARALLTHRDLLAALAEDIAPTLQLLSDTVLTLGADVRETVMPAYHLSVASSAVDEELAETVAMAREFYGAPVAAQQVAKRQITRQAKRDERAARAEAQLQRAKARSEKAQALASKGKPAV